LSIHITAFQNRDTTERITLRDADGVAITLAAGDKVRVKIGKSGKTPLLDIFGGVDMNGGTTMTNANPVTLKLYAADLLSDRIKPGVYDIEALVVDSADDERCKHAESGVFVLVGTQGGNTGISQ
jgi:hypothetical protein